MLVVDIRHWLMDDGSIPTTPPRLRKNALRVARAIEYGGALRVGETRETLIECTKRVNRKACTGWLWVAKADPATLHAYCATCFRDEMMITGWESTLWAEGMMEPLLLRSAPPDAGDFH